MATVTYTLRSANSDFGGGADFNKKLLSGTESQTQIVLDAPETTPRVSRGYTDAGTPGSHIGSTFIVEINVNSGNPNVTLSTQVHKVTSVTNQIIASSSVSAGQSCTNGVHTFTHAAAGLGAWTANERLRVDYRYVRVGANGTFAIMIGDANAQVTARGFIVAVNQAIENDDAQTVLWRPKERLVAQSAENDDAQVVASRKLRAVAQAVENDDANAVSASPIRRLVVAAVENDDAQAVANSPVRRLVVAAFEVDAARDLTKIGTYLVEGTREFDLAQAVARSKAKAFAQAVENDDAQVLTRIKLRTAAQVGEVDLAQLITWAPKIRVIATALELDESQPVLFMPQHVLTDLLARVAERTADMQAGGRTTVWRLI